MGHCRPRRQNDLGSEALGPGEGREPETNLECCFVSSGGNSALVGCDAYPVMPITAREIHAQLGLTDDVGKIDARGLRWRDLQEGVQIQEVKPLFPRIDKAKTMEEIGEQ